MKAFNLQGKEVNWKVKGRKRKNSSKLHKEARELIKDLCPTINLLEEVSIPVIRGKTLYLDFYMPLFKLAVEVQGEQHFKFSSMFHQDRFDLLRQVSNDAAKSVWCEINNITLLEFPYNERDRWREKIEPYIG